VLLGGSGDDRLDGGAGADSLEGGLGDDALFGSTGADTLLGGAGNDVLAPGADSDADIVDGGIGTDTVDYSTATAGVTVNLQAGTSGGAATGDSYSSVESVIGSNFADTLTAQDGGTADGGGRNDVLTGAGLGTTTILKGGAEADTLNAGSIGQELLQLELNNGPDTFINVARNSHGDKLLVDNDVFDIGLGVTFDEIRNQPAGPAAANAAKAQFIFLQTTRELYFDADGTGGAFGPVLLATVGFAETPVNVLFPGDFYVI
jgi:hypothetical protein